MAQKILVALKRGDRIEEVVPCLEEVTKPGMSVVFLIHHPVNGFKWLQAYSAIAECALEKTQAIRRMAESYSIKMRRQLAHQKVFHTCEVLQRIGAKVTVDVCTGSLRKTLQSHVNSGDTQLVVMRPGIRHRIMSFLRGTVSISSMFKRPSSVVLLHSGTQFSHQHTGGL